MIQTFHQRSPEGVSARCSAVAEIYDQRIEQRRRTVVVIPGRWNDCHRMSRHHRTWKAILSDGHSSAPRSRNGRRIPKIFDQIPPQASSIAAPKKTLKDLITRALILETMRDLILSILEMHLVVVLIFSTQDVFMNHTPQLFRQICHSFTDKYEICGHQLRTLTVYKYSNRPTYFHQELKTSTDFWTSRNYDGAIFERALNMIPPCASTRRRFRSYVISFNSGVHKCGTSSKCSQTAFDASSASVTPASISAYTSASLSSATFCGSSALRTFFPRM